MRLNEVIVVVIDAINITIISSRNSSSSNKTEFTNSIIGNTRNIRI